MKSCYSYRYFNDFELLAEAAKQWDLEFFQLDSGPANAILSQIANKDISSAYFSTNRVLRLKGGPPSHMWTIMLSSQIGTEWFLNNQAVPENAITVYPPGYDFDNNFRAGYECYAFYMAPEYFQKACEDLEVPELVNTLRNDDIFECSAATKQHLWQRAKAHKYWLDQLAVPEGSADLSFWHDFERELLRDILLVLAEVKSIRIKNKFPNRIKIFKTIDNYIEANPFETLTVHDLSRIASVKERTLQHNFQKYLGVPPKRYLKSIMLNRVRKELKRGSQNNSAKIYQIANQFGFWHMGQFAVDYRRLFGELPSETLALHLDT